MHLSPSEKNRTGESEASAGTIVALEATTPSTDPFYSDDTAVAMVECKGPKRWSILSHLYIIFQEDFRFMERVLLPYAVGRVILNLFVHIYNLAVDDCRYVQKQWNSFMEWINFVFLQVKEWMGRRFQSLFEIRFVRRTMTPVFHSTTSFTNRQFTFAWETARSMAKTTWDFIHPWIPLVRNCGINIGALFFAVFWSIRGIVQHLIKLTEMDDTTNANTRNITQQGSFVAQHSLTPFTIQPTTNVQPMHEVPSVFCRNPPPQPQESSSIPPPRSPLTPPPVDTPPRQSKANSTTSVSHNILRPSPRTSGANVPSKASSFCSEQNFRDWKDFSQEPSSVPRKNTPGLFVFGSGLDPPFGSLLSRPTRTPLVPSSTARPVSTRNTRRTTATTAFENQENKRPGNASIWTNTAQKENGDAPTKQTILNLESHDDDRSSPRRRRKVPVLHSGAKKATITPQSAPRRMKKLPKRPPRVPTTSTC